MRQQNRKKEVNPIRQLWGDSTPDFSKKYYMELISTLDTANFDFPCLQMFLLSNIYNEITRLRVFG